MESSRRPQSSSMTLPSMTTAEDIAARRLIRPTLRPGTTIAWTADGAAVIGARPGLRLCADASELFGLINRIRRLDGSRTWDEVITDIPHQLLVALVEAGSIIEAAGVGSHRAAPAVVDCCRARVVDGDADDAVLLAMHRQRSAVGLSGDPQMCEQAATLLRATGVRVVGDTRTRTRPAVAITVAHYDHDRLSLNPQAADTWLRAGIPHVCASVSGTRALIGPLTVPGLTPCTRCVTAEARRARGLTDSDVADIRCTHHRNARSPEAVALCLSLAIGRALLYLDGLAPSGLANSLLIDSSGRVDTVRHPLQQDCGCQRLPTTA